MNAPDHDSATAETKSDGSGGEAPRSRRGLIRWLSSTSRRTFVVYPVCIVAIELALRGGELAFVPWGLPLMAWGYAQYRWVGGYRTRLGGGGPGTDVPPQRIVESGPYRYLRNPMYLGHMIFLAGLAITLQSWVTVGLLAFQAVWFHRRVLDDEKRLEAMFGDAYRDYASRVKRWIPWLL